MIDDRQQARVDLVALRQCLVEVHRAHDRAQVGRRKRHDRRVEVADLIGRLGGVQHLEEDDAVDRDHRIVLGDDLLARDVEHLLHHVDLAADPIEERRDEVEAGLRHADEAAEMLDRVAIALMDDLHADHHDTEAREPPRAAMKLSQHLFPRMYSSRIMLWLQWRTKGKSTVNADLFAVRSVLFLPASNPRAIAKARESEADLVVLDLEDAVKPDDKETARKAAVDAVAIRLADAGRDPRSMASEREWHCSTSMPSRDRIATSRSCRGPRRPIWCARSRDAIGKPLLAMIETAAGVLAAPEIAREAAALIAGTNDLRADLRLPLDATREPISASLQMIVLAARAAGIPAFDGVFNRLKDPKASRRRQRRAGVSASTASP